MRFLTLALLAAVACTAHASFEMIIVNDTTNQQLSRIDPQTGTYLGSFGKGQLGAWGNGVGLALQGSTHSVDALDISGYVHHIDYSTGTNLGVLALQGAAPMGTAFANPTLKLTSTGVT